MKAVSEREALLADNLRTVMVMIDNLALSTFTQAAAGMRPRLKNGIAIGSVKWNPLCGKCVAKWVTVTALTEMARDQSGNARAGAWTRYCGGSSARKSSR